MEEKFKISIVIISVILIAILCIGNYYLFKYVIIPDFRWHLIFGLPIYLLLSVATVYCGAAGLIGQIQILKRKRK